MLRRLVFEDSQTLLSLEQASSLLLSITYLTCQCPRLKVSFVLRKYITHKRLRVD